MKNIKNLYLQLPKQHKIILSSFSVFLLLLLLIPSEKATASRQTGENSLEIGKRYQLAIPEQEVPAKADKSSTKIRQLSDTLAEPRLSWQTAKVRSGDSLAKIFKRFGFSAKTTHQVAKAKGKDSKLLKKLDVGDTRLNKKKRTLALQILSS